MDYQTLMAQAKELQREAAKARRRERAAIVKIMRMMASKGITIQQLVQAHRQPEGAVSTPRRSATRSLPSIPPGVYVSPDGKRWSGGRGRRPRWVQEILDNGGDLQQYRLAP